MLPPTITWVADHLSGHAELIDQTLLPAEIRVLEVRDLITMIEAIQVLRVRGAPAIGVAAGYGVVLGVRAADSASREGCLAALDTTCEQLAQSRPTAVNLFYALDRMKGRAAASSAPDLDGLLADLLDEARAIDQEDRQTCDAIGRHGAPLIKEGAGVLTHCNAGGLATAGIGTALAPMLVAHQQGISFRAYADETRPLWQGARLTTLELVEAGIDTTLLCDSAAASLMASGNVSLVITGADRIAANGDTANKIGTYGIARLAAAHEIPFYIAAPMSTVDFQCPSGSHIPIEQRPSEEVTCPGGLQIAPEGINTYNPAFDVTPAALIAGIITEHGIIEPRKLERHR